MSSFLAALAAIPRLATALESLVATLDGLNTKAAKARASKRRKEKDDAVDSTIAALVNVTPGGMPGEASRECCQADGASGISCCCNGGS